MTNKAAATVVTRSLSDDGWIVTWADDDTPASFFHDGGGSWVLLPSGVLGRQTRGTNDVRIPGTPDAIAAFVRRLPAYDGEQVEVRS